MTTWVLVLVIFSNSFSGAPAMTAVPVQFASKEACDLAGRGWAQSQPGRQQYGWHCVEARRT